MAAMEVTIRMGGKVREDGRAINLISRRLLGVYLNTALERGCVPRSVGSAAAAWQGVARQINLEPS